MIDVSMPRNSFTVREPCAVELHAKADHELTPGTTVECQFPNTWCLVSGPSFTRELQTASPAAAHYVAVTAPGTDAQFHTEITERHLTHPAGHARHGRQIIATLTGGTVPAGCQVIVSYGNTYAPYVAERETVWLRVAGEAPEQPPVLTVLGGAHQRLRLIAPSGVRTSEPFEVLAVSLDRFDNASSTAFSGERLCLADGTEVASSVDFTGSTRIQVSLDSPGTHRFAMRDAVSNAVRVSARPAGPYWGDTHIHTKLSSDAQGTDPYHYAREVSGLEFAAVADHWESLGEQGYRIVEEWARDAHEPGRFVTFPADERNPRKPMGHHNIYFRTEDEFRRHQAHAGRDSKVSPEAEAAYLSDLDPEQAMLIPHHTGISFGSLPANGVGNGIDWSAWDDNGLRPVIEVYSHHGQSELYSPQHVLAYEFNRMRNEERRANTSVPGAHYAQDYWMDGRRVGVIASSDEHSGQGGRVHGGVAAVYADALTRDALFDAIRQRRCYATTGERILIDFRIDGATIGECVQRSHGGKLDIALDVWGTGPLLRVEILRFRFGVDRAFMPVVSMAPRPESTDASIRTQDPLTGDAMYYARVTQEPLEWPGMAWTSPIWFDVVDR